MPLAIETTALHKSFGSVRAVIDLDLAVAVGEVFGFLGPNGAGKSTTIKLLLDQIRPSSGRASVLGMDAHRDVLEIHRRTGYLPSRLSFPPRVTAAEYLDFLGRLRGNNDPPLRRELVDRVGLDPSRRINDLSTGNQQKVGLVQAFMHRPELVLLDEPTTGLDPLIQHEVHELLAEFSAEGGTVFLSSHTLSEVDRVADRVGIIREGRLVTVDRVAALKAKARRTIVFEFDTEGVELAMLEACPEAVEVRGVGSVVHVAYEGSVDQILRAATAAGSVSAVEAHEADLEDVFLGFYRTDQAADAAMERRP